MNSVMVKIKIASAKDAARPTSSTQAGIGRIIITMIAISASARRTVGLKSCSVVNLGNGHAPQFCPTGSGEGVVSRSGRPDGRRIVKTSQKRSQHKHRKNAVG